MNTLDDYIAHLRNELANLPPLTDIVSQDERDHLRDALERAEKIIDEPSRDEAIKTAILSGIAYGAYLVLEVEADRLRDATRVFFQRRRGGHGKRAELPSNDTLREEIAKVKTDHPTWSLRKCRDEVGSRYGYGREHTAEGQPRRVVKGSTIERRLRKKKG